MDRRDKRGAWRRSAALVAVLAALAAGGAARAQGVAPDTGEDARRYAACMALAKSDPKAAHARALAWRAAGGGDPAMHCLSVALLGLGYYEQAARNMEALAKGMEKATPALRADLLGQAGNAWMIAGRPGLAYAAQSAALALAPDDVDLLIDRGITLAATANYWEALDDLNRALDLAPDRVDALVFRAGAWRHLDSLELAAEDAARALALAPDNVDALLERGQIRRKQGNRDGARADWLRVLDLDPDGPAAEAARRALEEMDVKAR